jgi:hypothetical protein
MMTALMGTIARVTTGAVVGALLGAKSRSPQI